MAFQFIRPFEILQGITTLGDNNESGKAKKAIREGKIWHFQQQKERGRECCLLQSVDYLSKYSATSKGLEVKCDGFFKF